jgi:hypothetical protein
VVVVGRGAVVVAAATVATGVVVGGVAGAAVGAVEPAVDPAGAQAEANPMTTTSSGTVALFTPGRLFGMGRRKKVQGTRYKKAGD